MLLSLGVCVGFWLLAAIGTVLLREVNAQLRPKRLALLPALFVSDVTPRGRSLQRCTIVGIVGFVFGMLLLSLAHRHGHQTRAKSRTSRSSTTPLLRSHSQPMIPLTVPLSFEIPAGPHAGRG